MSQTEHVPTDIEQRLDRRDLITELDLLDSPPRAEFKRLIQLAHRLLDVSVAQITFIAEDREWVVCSAETDPEVLDDVRPVCAATVSGSDSPTILADLSRDDTVDGDETIVNGEPHRAFAGFPITVRDTSIGGFCVWNRTARDWTERDCENLRLIADQLRDLIARRADRHLSPDQGTLERYVRIINNLSVGVFRTTPDGEIIDANPEVQSIMRADSEEQLKHQNLRDLYVDRSRPEPIVQKLQEQGGVHEEEVKVRRLDGEVFWALLSLCSVEENGKQYIDGTIRDITDRRDIRRSLRESEERLRTIVRNTRDVFTVINEDGTILYQSPSIETVLGYEEDELIEESAFDYIHPDDRDEIAETFSELSGADEDNFYREECRIRDVDGNWIWLEIEASSKYQSVWGGYLLVSRDITERKQTEKALRKRDSQFREMADNVDEVFWMHDTETNKVLYVSPAAEDIWGESRDNFLGSSERWLRSIVESDRERVKEHFGEHSRDEFDIEYRIERPDGEIRWIHDHGYPVKDDDGTVVRLVGTARDVTERKEAEMELEATIEELRKTTVSRNYLENIISTMPSTVMVVDDDGRIDRVNYALCDLLGYSRQELLGTNIETVITDETWPGIEVLFKEESTETIQNREVRYERKDETDLPVLFSASHLKDPNSGFQGFICVGLDISKRRETQEALEESERRFRQMAENINEVIYMYSADWSEMLYVNSQYEEIWGQSRSELEKNPRAFLDGIHSDDYDQVRSSLSRIANGEEMVLEYRVNKSEDDQRFVISEATPIQNEEGEVTRIVGSVRDITELKKTQEELEKAHDEKANLLKEVHHRVKNNMQIISSILSLHEQSDYRRPSRMLDECRNRITSMAMIHDMLYQSENLAEVSFDEYVEELVSSLVNLTPVPASSVDVSLNIEPSLELPLSQAVPCGLIIHELVSNACEHAFEADRENRLNVEIRDFNNHIVLRVQDNGPGFPEDFNPEEANSVGLEILRALAEHELGGTLKFDEDPMTTVEVEFELDNVKL